MVHRFVVARQGMRRILLLLLLCMVGIFCHRAAAEEGARLLVDLDATALSPGPVTSWTNSGSAGDLFTGEAAAAPVADDVGGRRAVTFSPGHYLSSSFKAPAEITGGHPFTVAVWAFVPAVAKRGVLVSWASRPQGTAEFGYGPGPDGAFFGWDKSAKYTHLPSLGVWHHIAWASGPEELCIYVDGVLDARRSMKLSPKPGGRICLGAGWDSVGDKATFPFHGSLARVQVWDKALTVRELRNTAGWFECFSPEPVNSSTVAAEAIILKWEAGRADVKNYRLRWTADEASAAADGAGANELQLGAPEYRPAGVEPGHTYFWRVDQIDAQGKRLDKGKVWRFTTDSSPASTPLPRDHVAGVTPATKNLSWTPGRYAVAQAVYFGTDREAVNSASATPVAKGLSPSTRTLPGPLPKLKSGTTYYWRVATDNGSIPAAAGATWAFRTADAPLPKDVTFFVGSDCHYGLGNNAALNRTVIDEMNWLPGAVLPKQVGGGKVRTPRGVVLDGDLLDKGFEPKTSPGDWAEFTRDYGLIGGDGRLAYPVFEGFGNHDGMTGKSFTREGIKQRNKVRPGLTMVSANGYHYSWDWDHVHLAQLNLFPGKDSADCIVGPPNHHPEDALGFLKDDLAKNVTDRDRIVIVFCHYSYTGGMADWWTEAAKDRFFDAIKGYRVILIHGHSHGAYTYTWKGIPAISDGATARPEGQTGDFLVVHLTEDQFTVAQRKMGDWGITLKAPLPGPAGAPAAAGAVR